MNTVADIMEQAANLLESGQLDWCQEHLAMTTEGSSLLGASSPTVVAVCAVGALDRAFLSQKEPEQHYASQGYRLAAFRAAQRTWGKSLPDWNDEPGRTKEEVIDFLKQAAKDLRNEGAAS